MDPDNGSFSSALFTHIQDLRAVLLRSLIAIMLGVIAAFWFYPELLQILVPADVRLAIFSPQEGLVAVLRIAVWSGVILTAPYWGYAVLSFILPGLKGRERRLLPIFMIVSLLFIALGFAAALTFTIPLANSYLYEFNKTLGENIWGITAYLDYTLLLLFAHGVTFEVGACLFFAVHLNLVAWRTLASYRRQAIMTALIVGALLTPPDVASQLFVAIPLYAFFEAAVWYGYFREKLLNKRTSSI